MKNILSVSAIALSVIVLFGCKKDPVTNVIEEDTHNHTHGHNLHFKFSHNVGGMALETDTIKYMNEANNMYSVVTCQYFISNIMLHYGGKTQLIDGAHYIDINDASTLTYSPSDDVEEGMYDSISMIVGLDSIKGAVGAFTSAPESNMAWPAPMGNNSPYAGYHYMKLEGKFDSAGVTKNYNAHFGPSMGKFYFAKVTLPASSFTKGNTNLDVAIAVNLNNWFTSPMKYDFNVYGKAVMMNMNAQMALMKNAGDVFSVTSIKE